MYTKVIFMDGNFSYITEILKDEEANIHPMYGETCYRFPASKVEYDSYNRNQADQRLWAPIRKVPNYYDVGYGVSCFIGYTAKCNRRQRKELYKNSSFTELFYEYLEEYEGDDF